MSSAKQSLGRYIRHHFFWGTIVENLESPREVHEGYGANRADEADETRSYQTPTESFVGFQLLPLVSLAKKSNIWASLLC
jgi:hypothetical protein